ncbi:hypothetical protein [Tichowtungia aerotolerans]|uniref:Glycosyltransferase RgtA/B/C/D-like domain-containing protein n=1 Tax=Tichowtungia aerotolerans TaxID=2697043 RepID=A0A6P1MCB3_9BACT|nr:hypothetical protein [Tichowtungia aerotolerans]QHI70204.1 hypothetical protein GT409_12390 [Tichowtungia aerotolerans]
MNRRINFTLLIVFAAASLWCADGLMRKNDQAAILAGAVDLARGQIQPWSAYYQFDKTYVLYGVAGAILKAVPGADPVTAANIGLALIFWTSLAVFIARSRERLSPAVLLCVLASPAVLFNTSYVNSSVLSSAFLLLCGAFVFRTDRLSSWLAALFYFLAVGSRSDVILLLPLLLWLGTPIPESGNFREWFSNLWKTDARTSLPFSNLWKLTVAGIGALILGPIFAGGAGMALDPFFNWKMVAGYTVFGFGAAGMLWGVQLVGLGRLVVKNRAVWPVLYGSAGLLALLIPVLFFLPQLHAPRYFWRGCEAVLLLSVTGRLPQLNRRWVAIFALAAVLPLLVGVRLPQLNQPQLTVTSPTCFPSGDGFYPMGAYGSFLWRLHHADVESIDHNQRVWTAARQTVFQPLENGTVPVLYTPMSGYLLLSASLRGQIAVRASFEELPAIGFYVDSRSLMRDDPKNPVGALNRILDMPVEFVSPESDGIGILRVGTGRREWGAQTKLLSRCFNGNEYLVYPADQVRPGDRNFIFFSKKDFTGARYDSLSGLYWSGKYPAAVRTDIFFAQAVLPSWMSLQAFKGTD